LVNDASLKKMLVDLVKHYATRDEAPKIGHIVKALIDTRPEALAEGLRDILAQVQKVKIPVANYEALQKIVQEQTLHRYLIKALDIKTAAGE
jgi:replicative DNA helicase